MLQENEVVMLLFGFGVFIFTLVYKTKIKRIHSWKFLLSGFYILLLGWLFTILEGFILKGILNLLEHMCYAISAIIVSIWCWKIIFQNKMKVENE